MPDTPALLDAAREFLDATDWMYESAGEQAIRFSYQGELITWDCYAIGLDGERILILYSVFPELVPDADRADVGFLISQINWHTRVGGFELNADDGTVRYKTSIDVEGDRLTPALFQQLVAANLYTTEFYLPVFGKVIEDDLPPTEAVEWATDRMQGG